ncbi:MAG TPA: hypothetical protein DIW52_13075 [Pseudomonas sp.]|nr:hypothetical protein [Pseudomonas sp.]
MIGADSFLLHEKSKTPPEIGGVFTSLDELRRTWTLSQLNKYTSQWRPRPRQREIASWHSGVLVGASKPAPTFDGVVSVNVAAVAALFDQAVDRFDSEQFVKHVIHP